MNQTHEFAIYSPDFFTNPAEILPHNIININNETLYHRIIRVLRLEADDKLIFFNQNINCLAQIVQISKKEFTIKIIEKKSNIILAPKITVLLSLLKREAFEDAIYACVELGANIIQPIITEKTHQKKWSPQDVSRLEKIIISASEQSKNFNFPVLKEPVYLEKFNLPDLTDSLKIYFDFEGETLNSLINKITGKKIEEIYLMTGPEGDLTIQEKNLIKKTGFVFCALTPTVLRSQTAVMLSIGILRSILK